MTDIHTRARRVAVWTGITLSLFNGQSWLYTVPAKRHRERQRGGGGLADCFNEFVAYTSQAVIEVIGSRLY